MKKLIITAHPNHTGFTHQIAKRFIATAEAKGDECELLDLYNDQWKQDYLLLGDDHRALEDPKRKIMQEKILRADELVYIFPLWNFDAPAVMKNRVDVNFSSGFAYRYRPGYLLPRRFLKGKRARIILTAGSPKRVILTAGIGILLNRGLARLFYFGIMLRSYTVFGKVPIATDLQKEKMLAKAERIARR